MRVSSQVDGSLDWEDSSDLAEVTDLGHDALRQYRKDHRNEDLESSVAHFQRALDICPDTHTCRAAVLFNLATVLFIFYQSFGTLSSFDRAIALHQEALKLRRDGHPDRSTTLLHLSQALLYHYGATGYKASVEAELRKLVDELMDMCPEGGHERRAASLALQTYQCLKIKGSDDSAELDKLIPILDVAAHEPPEAYFDLSVRFHNLGLALLRRFQLHSNPSDLDRAIMWLQETVRITHVDDLNKPGYLNDLGNTLLDRYQRLKDVSDLDQLIVSLEDAARLTPDGHQNKPSYEHTLSLAYLARFQRLKDAGDLSQGIFRFEDAIRLIPDSSA
ncbi:hypothetical protein OG21DRAFT_1507745 [Imleria badia]|nr:hypothetical protein OG21DRAFT_1507745 [Imleria badia]